MVRQLNPLGSGTSFQVSLIVPSQLAPNSTIMWLKPLLEMNYTEFPIYVPSSCELSKYKRVLTHPITQSHNSRIWCTLSRVCILYRELCVCVLYWGVVYDVWDLRRQMRRPKGSSLTLRENLEVDLQRDDFTIPLVVQHEKLTNEDLMESEPQRKDEERLEGKSPKNWRDSQPRE